VALMSHGGGLGWLAPSEPVARILPAPNPRLSALDVLKPFVFRVFRVFSGLTCHILARGAPHGSNREAGSASMPNQIPGGKPTETSANELRL
jgi:hypothetical protein